MHDVLTPPCRQLLVVVARHAEVIDARERHDIHRPDTQAKEALLPANGLLRAIGDDVAPDDAEDEADDADRPQQRRKAEQERQQRDRETIEELADERDGTEGETYLDHGRKQLGPCRAHLNRVCSHDRDVPLQADAFDVAHSVLTMVEPTAAP